MLLVIDSNVYLFTFGIDKKPSCEKLLVKIAETFPKNTIRIPRIITEEIRRNLTPESFKAFLEYVHALTTIDEDIVVPFEIAGKYEYKGLKPADAFIAAYTEWIGADILLTENRHFLSRQTDLPFKVLTSERCSLLMGGSK